MVQNILYHYLNFCTTNFFSRKLFFDRSGGLSFAFLISKISYKSDLNHWNANQYRKQVESSTNNYRLRFLGSGPEALPHRFLPTRTPVPGYRVYPGTWVIPTCLLLNNINRKILRVTVPRRKSRYYDVPGTGVPGYPDTGYPDSFRNTNTITNRIVLIGIWHFLSYDLQLSASTIAITPATPKYFGTTFPTCTCFSFRRKFHLWVRSPYVEYY